MYSEPLKYTFLPREGPIESFFNFFKVHSARCVIIQGVDVAKKVYEIIGPCEQATLSRRKKCLLKMPLAALDICM